MARIARFALANLMHRASAMARQHHHEAPTPSEAARVVRENLEDAEETAILTARVPTANLADACKGEAINLIDMIVVFVAQPTDIATPAMFPSHLTTDAGSWQGPFHKHDDLMSRHATEYVVAHALPGTQIQPGQPSHAERLRRRALSARGRGGLMKVELRDRCGVTKTGPCETLGNDRLAAKLAYRLGPGWVCASLPLCETHVITRVEARAGLVPASVFKTDDALREQRHGGFDSHALPPIYDQGRHQTRPAYVAGTA